MAVFRVERNKGYTVMSNHHLRNKELTLKAKGLLSQMLSLPEDWDYTLAGLSQINRESIDATRPLWLTTWQAAHLRQRSRTPPIHSNRAKACNHPQPPKEDFIMAQKMTGHRIRSPQYPKDAFPLPLGCPSPFRLPWRFPLSG